MRLSTNASREGRNNFMMKTINDLVWITEEDEPKEAEPKIARMSCGSGGGHQGARCSFCGTWGIRHAPCPGCGWHIF
jgi:hypothetical protein